MLELLLEENVCKDPAKPWISNRQIHVGFGTVLTFECQPTGSPLPWATDGERIETDGDPVLAGVIGQGTVVRVESQRTLGGVPLVKDGDGFFPRGELGVVDLAQVEDVTLDRAAGCAATFHDAPVSVDLPVFLSSVAAQEHMPTSYPEIRESRHGGRSALHGKSLLGADQSIGFPRKTDGRKGELPKIDAQ
jgi:hypothetical protein